MISAEDKRLLRVVSNPDTTLQKTSISITHFYFTNRDGSLRWVFPVDLRFPSFLNFYNESNTRSRIFKKLLNIVFYLNLVSRILLKRCFIEFSEGSILANILNRNPGCSYSIFMGTAGENRKIIIEINFKRRTLSFVKIAVSESAAKLVNNECRILSLLDAKDSISFRVPKVLNHSSGTLEVSNIKFSGAYQSSSLLPIHLKALNELASIGSSNITYNELPAKNAVLKAIEILENRPPNSKNNGIELPRLLEKLNAISNFLHHDSAMRCGMSHGDFTPWNMFIKKDLLYIIDWEMSSENIPILYDLFHYVFQAEILLNQANYGKIKEKIFLALTEDLTCKMTGCFNIDINQHFIFYLIFNITKYLTLYVEQNVPHIQIYWLVAAWEEALQDIIDNNGEPFK